MAGEVRDGIVFLERFADAGIAYEAAYKFIEMPAKYMDQTDLLPTLGGRVVGQTVKDGEMAGRTSLQVVRQLGADAVMAVDAITGNYPWQVDLYTRDMTSDFRKKLYAYSLETAHGFWDSLERSHSAELTWTDLRALNGIARVFYPMRDLSLAEVPDHLLARGPRQAVEIMGEFYGA